MIKKYFIFMLFFITCLSGCTTGETIRTALYDFKNYNKQYALINYKGQEENFIVPEEYNGKKIIALGKDFMRFRSTGINIKTITISKNIEQINRLDFCLNRDSSDIIHPNLQNIIVDDNNQYFSSFNGALYSKDLKTLYEIPYDYQENKYYAHENVEKIYFRRANYFVNTDIYVAAQRIVEFTIGAVLEVKIFVPSGLLIQYQTRYADNQRIIFNSI